MKGQKMTYTPEIPMRPEELPQQRLYSVVTLPPRPARFEGFCDFVDPMPENVRPKGSPRKTDFLGSVEWAWSPVHSRIDSYYINPKKEYWTLWVRWQDDNDWECKWRWTLYGYAKRGKESLKEASIYLLMDAWASEMHHTDLDKYHWIDGVGSLSVSEISEIARRVWPEA